MGAKTQAPAPYHLLKMGGAQFASQIASKTLNTLSLLVGWCGANKKANAVTYGIGLIYV